MISQYFDLLISLLFSPIGLIGIIALVVSLNILYKRKYSVLYFVAFMAGMSSIVEYTDESIRAAPPLVFPLEQLKQFARPITMLLLGLVSVYHLSKFKLSNADSLNITNSLLFIQILIFIKNLLFGDIFVAILVFLTFFLVFHICTTGFNQWVKVRTDLNQQIRAFTFTLVFLNFLVLYQLISNSYAITFAHGRLMGLTGNPQQFAVLLTTSIPLIFYQIIEANNNLIHRGLYLALLLWNLFYLINTGSRTGFAMFSITALLFLWAYKNKVFNYVIIIGLVGLTTYLLIDNGIQLDENDIANRITSTENTREKVYAYQWKQFLLNPLWGSNHMNTRLHFSENSYLGVAGGLGLLGLIPLCILVLGLLKMCYELWKKSLFNVMNKHSYIMVVSGIIPLLLGGITEAYLLGNITWPLIMLFTYTNWGYFLLKNG